MNKESKFIAVLVVIFIFSIQLLVFESYQSKNNNDDDDDNNNDNVKFDFNICKKLLDAETCKQIEDNEIIFNTNTNQLSKEEMQAEEITRKYLEPADPNQDTNTILGQMRSQIIESENTQNQGSLTPYTTPTPPSVNTPAPPSSIPSLSLENLNILDQNQLIDAISSKISQLRGFEKNKITQALFELTQGTAAKGGDVMKNLRQIGTTIIQDPSAPLIDRILGIAQTK